MTHPGHQGRSSVARASFGLLDGVETLAEIAQVRAERAVGAGFRFLFVNQEELPEGFERPSGEDQSVAFSYAQAFEVARRAAFHLASRGVGRGDKVLVVMPTGPGFLAAFIGCQLLGAVPVPAVPPFTLRTIDEYVARIVKLATNAHVRAVVTIDKLVPVFRLARSASAEAKKSFSRVVLARELLAEDQALDYVAAPDPDAPALIQYTSGSTGTPKGVVLSHRALLANVKAIGQGAAFREGDTALAWLPLFHDMGLIGHFIAAHVWGMPLVLLPPEVFVKRPKEWLRAITRYKGTCSASPNFGYALCVRKVKEEELATFDLSSWRVAFCGAEPIAPDTVRSFSEKFAKSGFAPGAFFPVYGMAELSLAATFPPPGRPPVLDRIERDSFERTGVAVPAADSVPAEQCMTWVSVGSAVPGHEVRIVGKDGSPLPERHEGEIQVRGPSLMSGYFENPVATAEAIQGGWLRTGDLGYLASHPGAPGELYVTGRSKEMISKSGRNLYPQDIERAASTVEGVRAGCCAAFGVRNDARGTEDLVLVAETKSATLDAAGRDALATEIKRAVFDVTGASPDVIVLVAAGTVPKTSSGKIQRDLTRKRYMKNDLERGGASLATLARLKIAQVVESLKSFVFRSP